MEFYNSPEIKVFYDFRLMSFFKSSLLSKKYRFHIIYCDNASNTIFILSGVLEIAFFICLFNEIWLESAIRKNLIVLNFFSIFLGNLITKEIID
jgi:hypothetical protein